MGKIKNLKGQRFGRLVVPDKYELRKGYKSTKAYWLCLCDCGNEKWIRGTSITGGESMSCGCYMKENNSILQRKRMLAKGVKNLEGTRVGRLLITSNYKRVKCGESFVTKWLCDCDCGIETWVQTSSLTKRKDPTRSCGCLARERASEVNSKEFGIAAMNAIYAQYRNRANRKKISFELSKEEFKEITMKKCFYCGSDLSNFNSAPNNNGDFSYNGIDRLDNTEGYELDNCVPCCSICNRGKDVMSKEEFLGWIEKVYKFNCK